MPRLDGTGPQGQGALSGRRLEQCDNTNESQDTGFGQKHRQRRQNRQGLCGNTQSLETRANHHLVSSINSLRAQIEAFQACLSNLKADIKK